MAEMNVDIYIKEVNGTRQIRVPWLPAKIDYEAGGMIVASYDILNRGTVERPTAMGLAKIKWDSQFPGKNRTDDALMRGPWKDPKTYRSILQSWITNKTPLNIIVTGYPINKDVFLTKYKISPAGGFGDMEYSVEFTENKTLKVEYTKKKANKDKSKARPKVKYTTYKIKKKDSLWKIAKKKLGKGKRWKEIYKLNKKVIEAAAKKHGRKSSKNGKYLYPGTKIKLPKK